MSGGEEPKSMQCTILTPSSAIVNRSVVNSVLYFSKDIDQSHFLCRWRSLRCATSPCGEGTMPSLYSSKQRTKISVSNVLQTVKSLIWHYRSILTKFFSLSPLPTVLPKVVYNLPDDRIGRVGRDLKINGSIIIQHKSRKISTWRRGYRWGFNFYIHKIV